MTKCPSCSKSATVHPVLGILPCTSCQAKTHTAPTTPFEFTTDDIKRQRQEYANDIEQPHYKGALNKRFVEIYGEKAALDRGFSQDEVKKAKYTYDGVAGLRYYKDNA